MTAREEYRRWSARHQGSDQLWVEVYFRRAAGAYQRTLLAEAASLRGVPGHRIVAEPGRAVVVIPS